MFRIKLIRNLNVFGKQNQLYAISKRTAFVYQKDDFTLELLEGSQKGIAVGTMAREKSKNALSNSLITQFGEAIEILAFERSVSAFILKSSVPKVFCAGADLKERLKMTSEEVSMFVTRLRQLSSDISDLPMPTIAAIEGAALGGGLEYALSCDLRVASDSAKMGLVETSLAVIPGAARVIDGNEAFRIGLVNYVVPQNEEGNAAYLKALEVAEKINSNGPKALRMAKMAVDKGCEIDLKSGLAFEEAGYAQIINTKDRIEALKAFQEKRPKRFTGE